MSFSRRSLVKVAAALVALGSVSTIAVAPAGATAHPSKKILAVGAENEYANVISQIGGRYVSVSAIESNPNTDPHTFEASPSVAKVVSAADLIVQNGVGYDTYMNKIEAASPSSKRKVITVQTLLNLPDDTLNPHLWYNPETMPTVALAITTALSGFEPAETSYFEANLKAFDASLQPWLDAIVAFDTKYPNTPVATTEPVGDYMLQAAGTDNMTPWTLQADIMNGVDPAPQNASLEENLFSQHKVKVFVYNQQVTDSLTATFLSDAKRAGIPVVGVYETMPTPGYDYQTWMLAEVNALMKALSSGQSTQKL
jgi:zinc/manganese transport system substrate-binding protein